MISMDQVKRRAFSELFDQPVLDNTMRGIWCEFMVAEALGAETKIVSHGWHPWDLQIGRDDDQYPDRIRIQIKNSARIQTWNKNSNKLSDCQYELKFRKRPTYFEQDNPNTPCEEIGFLCDIYILCLHDEEDTSKANQLDPHQWKFYLAPVVGRQSSVISSDVKQAMHKLEVTGNPTSFIRRPKTLEAGIRNRPPIIPLRIDDLSCNTIRDSLGLR